jgi:cytochrome c heme-lyase
MIEAVGNCSGTCNHFNAVPFRCELRPAFFFRPVTILPMGQSASQPSAPSVSSGAAKCPVDHSAMAKQAPPATSGCPVPHDQRSAAKEALPAECPVDHSALNNMPVLSQAPTANQSIALPTDREESSIPRDESGKWEYPSPQQFYNALVRKGWETPEEHVEVMVQIHNFLNERAWDEVLRWEKRADETANDVQLARFMGKPGQLSPKARFWLFAGSLFPSRFKYVYFNFSARLETHTAS